jgi:signal transduction histidine kinase
VGEQGRHAVEPINSLGLHAGAAGNSAEQAQIAVGQVVEPTTCGHGRHRGRSAPTRARRVDRCRNASYARRRSRGCAPARTAPRRLGPTVTGVRRWPRPAIVLSALAVGVFQLVGSFGAAANHQTGRSGMDALAVVLVLLGPLALAVRDRWPLGAVAVSMAAASVYVGLGYVYGPIFVSVVVAMTYAVLVGHRTATWLLTAIGFAGFIVATQLDPNRGDDSVLVKCTLVAGWLVVVLAIAELIRSRRAIYQQRVWAETEARQRMEGEQRLQLAQELHDVLAHHISLINVQAGVALHLIDEQPERARPALANIKEASREALRDLRGALEILRRGEVVPRSPAPGPGDLNRLVTTVAATGLDVRLDEEGRPDVLPAAVELAAFRIVQEALTNVSRHAGARSATVRVRYDDDMTVEVVDDGIGGDASAGNGITGMRERAAALGGTVEARPGRGGGFRVVARLPFRPRVTP